MTICTIWCEWDMGWNYGDSDGIYKSIEDAHTHLESINWQDVGYDTWQDVEEDGLLNISTLEI